MTGSGPLLGEDMKPRSTRRWLADLAALTGIALLVAVAAVVLRVAALRDEYFPRHPAPQEDWK